MKNKNIFIALGIGILVIVGFIVSGTMRTNDVQADDAYRYILYAAFGEEGGTVATTTPFGQAVLNVNEGEERVDYRIAIRNGRGVVGAGVYCTLPDGTQSKQILNLYGGTSASGALLITGSFVAHDIAETAHECEPAIETLEHLLQAVQEGEILFVVRYNREGEHHVTANLKITDYIAGFTIERHESDLAENMAETSDSSSSAQGIDIAQRNTSPLAMSVQSDNSISSGTTSNTSQNSIQTRQSMYWPFVAPNSHHVNRGGSIYFTGERFAPNEIVAIRSNGSLITTVSANAAGSFITDKLVVPHESGTKTYTFVGQQSGSSFTVSVKISDTDPWITLNTYYAGAGTALTINGHAFGSGETISIRFGGIVVGIAVANQNGNFTFTTKVPAMGAGEKVVHVQGEVSGKYDTEIFSQAF